MAVEEAAYTDTVDARDEVREPMNLVPLGVGCQGEARVWLVVWVPLYNWPPELLPWGLRGHIWCPGWV